MTDTKRVPKTGDTVLVRDSNNIEWSERIYLCTYPFRTTHKYVVVYENNEDKYRNGEEITSCDWRYMKPLPKEEPKKH